MIKFFSIAFALVMFATPVLATDEFGARFSEESPVALADPAAANEQAAAEAMQNIEPAAGDASMDGVEAEAMADEAEMVEAPAGPGIVAEENMTEY